MSHSRTKIIPLLVSAVILLIAISLACNLPAGLQERFFASKSTATPTPSPTFTPQPLPPTILESEPPAGSSIPLQEPITIYFNQDMDQASVESAISGEPALSGPITWKDSSTLVYSPDSPLEPNSSLAIKLGTSAKAQNGLSLLEPLQLEYYVPDNLLATHLLPLPGGSEIDPSSAVVVTFNQPVVPLGATLSDSPPAFTITPAVSGTGEWINTSTYMFTADPGLSGGVTYQAKIAASLTSAFGSSLDPESPASWTFSTSYPQLLDYSPHDGAGNVELDAGLELNFNQAMDPVSVNDNLRFVSGTGQNVGGEFEWSDDYKDVVFVPDDLLERSMTYAVVIPGEVKAAGGTPLQLDTSWTFQAVDELRFLGTPGGQSYTTSIYEGVTLYFNSPIDRSTVKDNITLIPEVEDLRPSTGGSGTALQLYGSFDPLTKYALVMSDSLADEWGSTLANPISIKFTTEPLRSNLTITQGSNILFITGSENVVPAIGTNLYQVSVNAGTIPQEDFNLFFGSGSYTSLDDYSPIDVTYWNHIFNVPGDDSYTVNLPLNQAGTSLAPGLYRYQIYSQELPYNPSPYLLAVSNVHMTMKTSPQGMMIWAVDLETGAPIQNAEITIYIEYGKVFSRGRTNQQGVFEGDFEVPLDLYDNIFYAVIGSPGQDDFGITASNWGFGTEPYSFSLRSDFGVPKPSTYIYTDRPIYRPGQTVYFRLVHRLSEDGSYILPSDNQINVTIDIPRGEDQDILLPLSEYGTAHGEYQLSSYAQPGYYQIKTKNGMIYFQVAEYRKPEIDLEVKLDTEQTLIDNSWNGTVDARYYFDAPASQIPLTWSLRASSTTFYLPGYQVGELGKNWLSNYPSVWGTSVESGESETDADGLWEIDKPLSNVDAYENVIDLPALFTFNVTAEDETGFQVSSQAEMVIHPSEFYIGIRPSSWIGEADQEAQYLVKVVDWEKEADGVRNLKAEFNRITWRSEYGEFGQIENFRDKELITSKSFSTNRNGEANLSFTPSEPGTYQLDVYGEGARTEVVTWVGGAGRTIWPNLTNQKINLVADQVSYQPGDEAEVFIPNPFSKGAQALITVERHKVISYQTMSISGAGETVQIPLGEEEIPNVYISATLLGQNDDGIVDFRQGYLNLLVEPISKEMNVEIIGKPERLGPREDVEFTIRVTDQAGKPLVGEFTLAVVDKAVLALVDPNSIEIDEAFFGVQPIAVRMGIPIAMHAGRNVFIPGGMGGGGGGEAYFVRSQFEDTGYWQADVVTNEKGEAQVTITLPDNLTTWQAETRGVTKDTKVGQASTEIITTKDFLVRPVTPRFLVVGDHLALAAVVHNNTGEDLTADVTLQAGGVRLDIPDYQTQIIEIPDGGRTRVEWWGTVEDVEIADILFIANAGEYKDAVKPYLGPLPVSRYTALQTFGTSGIVEGAEQKLEIVTLPKTFDPKDGSLDIELSPSLAASLLTALDALEQDKYYSTIAVQSRFLPNVLTYQTLQELGLDYPQLESRLEIIIPDTLDLLASAQNEDGGWGWWEGSASDVEISSFILFGLTQAEKAGVFVDELMMQSARGYLLATLPGLEMLNESWQYDQLAFRYFALTEAQVDVSGGMIELAALRSQLSPYAQALLALALETQLPGNSQAQTLYSDLVGRGIRTATGIHWENSENCRCWLNNTTTTTAIVSYALAREDNAAGTLPEAIRYLISTTRPRGDWGSAYETGWAILALNEALKATGDLSSAYDFSSDVNGSEVITGKVEGGTLLEAVTASIPVGTLYAEDPNALVVRRGEGDGTLYYKAHLNVVRPAEDVPPFGKGMSVSRVYATVSDDSEFIFTQEGKVGELIQVRLTLVLEHDAHYLMVEDRIPSGVEILDTRLKTSQQEEVNYQVSSPFREGWGWWYFNSPTVFDDRISWSASYLPAGTYQFTYTISLTHPGEYQVLPARGWLVYFPETQAISAGEKFVVHPAD